MNILNFFDFQFLFYCVYFLGIIFFGISIFDRSTPRGGGATDWGGSGPMYRGRGGMLSLLITILWAVLGISLLGSYNFLSFDFKLLVSIFIGGLAGYGLWKLFILYNWRINMENIEAYRKIKKGGSVFWAISSAIVGLFFFVLGYVLTGGNLFVAIVIYLISLPAITFIGARINWR